MLPSSSSDTSVSSKLDDSVESVVEGLLDEDEEDNVKIPGCVGTTSSLSCASKYDPASVSSNSVSKPCNFPLPGLLNAGPPTPFPNTSKGGSCSQPHNSRQYVHISAKSRGALHSGALQTSMLTLEPDPISKFGRRGCDDSPLWV